MFHLFLVSVFRVCLSLSHGLLSFVDHNRGFVWLGSLRETTEDFMACVSVAEKVSK